MTYEFLSHAKNNYQQDTSLMRDGKLKKEKKSKL